MNARLEMKLNILFSCIFGIGPASFLARADWVDEQKKHAETNLDANNKPSWSQAEYHTPNDLFLEFSEIRNSRAFIDKTFFLHEWLTHRPKHWYVTAPPGFGKTALAKMAVQFLNASAEIVDGVEKFHDRHKTAVYELFQGTNIFEMKEFFDQHFQNYAVIYVDLAPLSNTTEAMYLKQDDFNTQDFHIYFRLVIKKMMSYYPSLLFHQSLTDIERERFREYLENGMETAVRPTLFWNCVSFLKEMLKKTLKKEVIVIIDSYDALCKPSMVGDLSKLQRPYIGSYMINFSKLLLQDRLATVLYLGTINTRELMLLKPSDVGMQMVVPITHTPFSTDERLAKYFGLSKQEVDDILSKHSMEEHLGVVNDLLNGHAVIGSSLTLFNTKYVLSYIEHRNASTIAFTMPSTTEILHHYRKIFSVELISNVVTPCVYKDKTEMKVHPLEIVSFASFTRLTILMGNMTGVQKDRRISPENIMSFIKLLRFLGLMSVIDEKKDVSNLRASSRSDAECLNSYLYSSGSVEKFFKISAQDELTIVRAMKGLAATDDSVQLLGEAIHNIIKEKVPESEYQLKSLLYLYSRRVAIQYPEDFVMEAEIAAPTTKYSEFRAGDERRIDVILLQKNKGIGIILTSKFDVNATSVLKEMVDFKYSEILDSDLRFSKFPIQEKILIAISVTRNKSVEIATEVWHNNEKTVLKYVNIT